MERERGSRGIADGTNDAPPVIAATVAKTPAAGGRATAWARLPAGLPRPGATADPGRARRNAREREEATVCSRPGRRPADEHESFAARRLTDLGCKRFDTASEVHRPRARLRWTAQLTRLPTTKGTPRS